MMARFRIAILAVLSTSLWTAYAGVTIGTAFTYQGQLKQDGAPANGNLDMEFRLFDAAALGNQVGNPVTLNGVAVANGLFTVTLNADGQLGPSAFNGEQRWLQITVDGTTLTPRQALTAAPYATTALSTVLGGHSLDAADGNPINAVYVDNEGNVGIGTSVPQGPLEVRSGSNSYLRLDGIYGDLHFSGGDDGIFALFNEGAASGRTSIVTNNVERFTVLNNGNVGIGTNSPTAQLDVDGAARTTTLEITGGSPFVASLAGWGDNSYGQTNVPSIISTFTAVSAGALHGLAIRSDGTLVGWGYNFTGQINVPFGTFTAVAAGGFHSQGIRSDGTLVGWGGNAFGQIDVPSGTFTAVAAGSDHSLAMRSDGTLAGWGRNDFGQINVPAGTFTGVAASDLHSLGIRSDGTLVGWGNNAQGQTNVPSGTFVAVAAGWYHSLAIRSDGTLVGWGYNGMGQINVPSGTFTAVAAGEAHSLAIRSDGTLVGWGSNSNGQINVPAGTFTDVAAGRYHSLGINSNAPLPDPTLRLHTDSALKPGSNTWTIFSDRRLKKNIEPLTGALDRLLQLRGVTFQWLDPASQGGITGTQMGLIADEVSRAFPQWVGRDPKGYQTLTVGGFEALTAEALRELRAEKNAELLQKNAEIAELRQRLMKLEVILEHITNNQREENK